jgi:hypothetical protein
MRGRVTQRGRVLLLSIGFIKGLPGGDMMVAGLAATSVYWGRCCMYPGEGSKVGVGEEGKKMQLHRVPDQPQLLMLLAGRQLSLGETGLEGIAIFLMYLS